jgi:hypothetical protein
MQKPIPKEVEIDKILVALRDQLCTRIHIAEVQGNRQISDFEFNVLVKECVDSLDIDALMPDWLQAINGETKELHDLEDVARDASKDLHSRLDAQARINLAVATDKWLHDAMYDYGTAIRDIKKDILTYFSMRVTRKSINDKVGRMKSE